MPYVTNEQIFAALFALVSQAQGSDWNGDPMPLNYTTRNWTKAMPNAPEGQYPALFQLDPLQERDVRTGVGRSRRYLHAMIDIRLSRQKDQQSYPEDEPFATILNSWSDSLRTLLTPTDMPLATSTAGASLAALVQDYYPVDFKYDYGIDRTNIAVVQCIVEIYTGG